MAEEVNSSKDVIFAWAAFSSIEGWNEESVKSQTRILPSAEATNRTAGRVFDHAPAVRYADERGELNSGLSSPNYGQTKQVCKGQTSILYDMTTLRGKLTFQMWKFQSETVRTI